MGTGAQLEVRLLRPRFTRGQRPRSMPARWVGSSPRARGTVRRDPVQAEQVRFIPACAGNRRWPGSRTTAATVHPRVRGEQIRSLSRNWPTAGSSPRARGTGRGDDDRAGDFRFIPACAGNRVHPHKPEGSTPVHPRVRGEQTAWKLFHFHAFGDFKEPTDFGAPSGADVNPRAASGRRRASGRRDRKARCGVRPAGNESVT